MKTPGKIFIAATVILLTVTVLYVLGWILGWVMLGLMKILMFVLLCAAAFGVVSLIRDAVQGPNYGSWRDPD